MNFSECDCNPEGTTADFCDTETGQCICKDGFGGSRCDQCAPGFFKNQYLPFFQCDPCDCSENGSTSEICDPTNGQCPCKHENILGRKCNQCRIPCEDEWSTQKCQKRQKWCHKEQSKVRKMCHVTCGICEPLPECVGI